MARSYLLEIDFQLRSEKRREFNSSLESLFCGVGSGHVRASAYEDRDDGNHLLLVLEWGSRPDLDVYLESKEYGTLLACLRILGSVTDCRVVDLTGSLGAGSTRWVTGRETGAGGAETPRGS